MNPLNFGGDPDQDRDSGSVFHTFWYLLTDYVKINWQIFIKINVPGDPYVKEDPSDIGDPDIYVFRINIGILDHLLNFDHLTDCVKQLDRFLPKLNQG